MNPSKEEILKAIKEIKNFNIYRPSLIIRQILKKYSTWNRKFVEQVTEEFMSGIR